MGIEIASKDVVTGYWGESSKLRSRGYALVSVSRGNPKGVLPDMAMPFLAPTWNMMKMSAENYNANYQRILDAADPEQVWEFLPEKAALMCFEKHPQWCHRRMLAEWLEEKLGVEVTEFGYPRSSVVAYNQMSGNEGSVNSILENVGRPPKGVPVYHTDSLF